MSYNAVPTSVTGDFWTAANNNTYIRDNFKAGIPDIFAAAGDIGYATAANAASALPVGNARERLQVNAAGTAPEWSSLDIGCTLTGTTVDINSHTVTYPQNIGGTLSFPYYKVNFDTKIFGVGYWNASNPDAITIPEDGVYQIAGYARHASTSVDHVISYFRILLGQPFGDSEEKLLRTERSVLNYEDRRFSFSYVDKYYAGDDAFLGIARSSYQTGKVDVRYSIRRLYGLG